MDTNGKRERFCANCFWNISTDDVEQMVSDGEITEEEAEEGLECCGLGVFQSDDERHKNNYICSEHSFNDER